MYVSIIKKTVVILKIGRVGSRRCLGTLCSGFCVQQLPAQVMYKERGGRKSEEKAGRADYGTRSV